MPSQQISTNTFTAATWIVNSDATKGTHTTLAGALTSASAGDTILIQTSVTENPTFKVGVNIMGYAGAQDRPNVSITGKCTFTTAGTVNISNIQFITNSDFCIAVTGSAASVLNLHKCYINCTNNTGISFTTSSSSAQINFNSCTGNLGTTGISYYTSTSAGSLNFNMCTLNNSGGSSTASTASAGNISYFACGIGMPTTTSSTGGIQIQHCNIDTSGTNSITVTHGGSGNAFVFYTYLASGTAATVSVSASIQLVNIDINSTNANPVTGAGTVNFSSITFSNTGKVINTTTQAYYPYLLGTPGSTAPTAGFIGEVLSGSNTTGNVLVSNTINNITSVTLTPGIWDVSGMTYYAPTGANTSTYAESSIATANNSLTPADNFGSGVGMLNNKISGAIVTASTGTNIALGPGRLSVSANTTYFLNVNLIASVINAKGFGVIRAVRIG